jgi:hypothetical protein
MTGAMSTPADGAVIAVTRERGGTRDLLRSYRVMIDSHKVGQVRRGQRIEVPVSPGRHKIFLQIDWCTSPVIELDAKAGEIIELDCAPGGSPVGALASVVADTGSYIQLTRR